MQSACPPSWVPVAQRICLSQIRALGLLDDGDGGEVSFEAAKAQMIERVELILEALYEDKSLLFPALSHISGKTGLPYKVFWN